MTKMTFIFLRGFIPILITLFLVSGCNEEKAIRDWVIKIEPLRNQARVALDEYPYEASQHQAFKNYFSELENLAFRLSQEQGFIVRFNNGISQVDLKDVCTRIFIVRPDWESLMLRCTRNEFFLCSDDVKYYPDMVAMFRQQLVPTVQQKFDSIEACKSAL